MTPTSLLQELRFVMWDYQGKAPMSVRAQGGS